MDRDANGYWKAGESGNPTGRPAGARNRSSYELRERLRTRGDIDPADFLSWLVSNENEPKELRIAASGQLMPYYHSKLGATPVPPPPQYIEEAISLPRPGTIRQAYENIAILTEYKATGKIDIATADSLIADQRVILNALIDEAKLLASAGDPNATPTIRIEGGLPRLPGTSVIMPSDPPYEPGFQDPGAIPKANGHGEPDPNSPQEPDNGAQ
jgi:hypothetical protein